jgi:hypothetical protein
MQKLFDWIKSNKIATVLILVLGFFAFKRGLMGNLLGTKLSSPTSVSYDSYSPMGETAMVDRGGPGIPTPPQPEATPQPDVDDRMTVRNAELSLHVKEVSETIEALEGYVDSVGGYVVSSTINTPQESTTGRITLRVPTERLDAALEYFKDLAVTVVQENVRASDITDQYVDTKARLETLEKTKAIFEGILDSAEDFDDILRANREILNIQSQIDSVKGQIQYMEGTSSTALVSVQLSTDPLELGYAPQDAWRPGVVFKQAVRSLVANSRQIGNTGIWISVYAVIWVPVIVGFLLVKKWLKKRRDNREQG